jgi:hypothetical protein
MLHLLSLIGDLLTSTASAQISGPANTVSNGLFGVFGGGGYVGIAEAIRSSVLLVLTPVGIFIIVRAGLRLINSQEDDKLTKARTTIASTCVGLMLAYVSDRLVAAFYTPGGTWNNGSAQTGANILTLEIAGILNFFATLAVVVSVFIIIISGLRAVSAFGKDEGTGVMKQAVAGVATGLFLMIISGSIKLALGLAADVVATEPTGSTPDPIIQRIVDVVGAALGFLALVALAVVVYAGVMMVLSAGNEDQYKKSKDLIIRSMIGLVVILLAGAAVVFIQQLVI